MACKVKLKRIGILGCRECFGLLLEGDLVESPIVMIERQLVAMVDQRGWQGLDTEVLERSDGLDRLLVNPNMLQKAQMAWQTAEAIIVDDNSADVGADWPEGFSGDALRPYHAFAIVYHQETAKAAMAAE